MSGFGLGYGQIKTPLNGFGLEYGQKISVPFLSLSMTINAQTNVVDQL
jgi:hypothetical protein